jgi:hypothetical protein
MRSGLSVRFLVVELNHLGSNHRFNMSVTFTANYFFSGRRRPHRQQDALGDRFCESQDQTVRNVIFGSPDRETDSIRALIRGACRVWQWAPSRAAPQ